MKAQAAIEYLVTYSWALLIMAVVIGVLFELGVFNLNNYVARASPGSCSVYRPFGPDTTQQINLQGLCSTTIPKFVAFFDGKNSHINITNQSASLTQLTSKLTITAWIYASNSLPNSQTVLSKANPTNDIGYIFPDTSSGWNTISFSLYVGGTWEPMLTAPYPGTGTWHFVAATYDGSNMNVYIDGSLAASEAASGPMSIDYNNITVGDNAGSNRFSGRAANIQIYNISLSANQIHELYIEGIGGHPAVLQSLVGWWQLNGDTNDYSGNGNTGISNTIIFSEAWTDGYSTP